MAGAAPLRKAVVGVALLAGLASCSSGGDGGSRAAPGPTTAIEATTTSSAPPASSTTVSAPTTVTARPPTTASPSPEAAARSLYDAWTRGDRAAAGRVAEPAAVTTLFGRTWQAGDGWAFSECTGAAGSSICTWSRAGSQQVLMRVGNAPASVTEVRFQP